METDNDKLIEELININININVILSTINKIINREIQSEENFTLAPTQMMAIAVLKSQSPVNMTQLSKLLNIPRQQSTKVIDALAAKGLVSRYKTTDNRRIVTVEISPKGQDCLHNFFYDRKEQLLKLAELFNDKQTKDFIEMLSTIKQALLDIETKGA